MRGAQAEVLSPAEIEAALAIGSVAYLPLGTLEFHGPHLPIGLDALNAHALCLAAAARTGGIVLPPVYQGTGGGHTAYPWTIMVSPGGIRAQILETLEQLEGFGVRVSVVFTGHFADEQLALVDEIAVIWGSGDHSLTVIGTAVNRCPSSPITPDHAGVFETTLLHSFWPDLVHLDRLPDPSEHPAIDPDGNPQGAHRHDPAHPLWGVFGPDPRGLDLTRTGELREALVAWLSAQVESSL